MKVWTDWEIVRHQVAIGGRVVDGSDKPVGGVQVTIITMPRALRQKLDNAASAAGADWQNLDERFDRTLTKADGIYYFLDLPAGRYRLKGVEKRSGAQDEKTVSVAWDRNGSVKRARADLKVSHA